MTTLDERYVTFALVARLNDPDWHQLVEIPGYEMARCGDMVKFYDGQCTCFGKRGTCIGKVVSSVCYMIDEEEMISFMRKITEPAAGTAVYKLGWSQGAEEDPDE